VKVEAGVSVVRQPEVGFAELVCLGHGGVNEQSFVYRDGQRPSADEEGYLERGRQRDLIFLGPDSLPFLGDFPAEIHYAVKVFVAPAEILELTVVNLDV
jgi:hypothetical protein